MLPRGHLVGNVCTNPEVKQTQQGKEYINLVIACKEKGPKTHFLNLNSWVSDVNLYIKNGVEKGDKVLVEFSLHTYVGSDGKKHITLNIESIEVIVRSKLAEYRQQESTEEVLSNATNEELAEALKGQEQIQGEEPEEEEKEQIDEDNKDGFEFR